MGRILKFAGIAVAALAAVPIAAAILFVLLFDANDFRDEIEAGVEQATGRQLTIEGDIDLSILPWFAIGMQRVELGNAPGFGDAPFASFDSIRFSVRVLPLLLGREIAVGTAAIDSLRVNLAVDENGRTNWEDLTATAEPVETAPQQEAGSTAALDVASVEITDAAITYTDAQAGSRYSITDLYLRSGRVVFGEPVALSGGLFFGLEPQGIRGIIELDLSVDFDPDVGIEVSDLTLRLDDSTFTGRLSLPFDPERRIEAELVGDRIDITRYMTPASEAEETGEATDDPVELPVELIRQLDVRASFTLAKALFGRLEFDNIEVVADVADDRLRIHPIAADFYDGGYRGDISIDASGDVPALSVDESISGVSLTPLAQALFDRDNVTGRIDGNFELTGRGEDVDAIRRDLDGSLRFELSDGAWQGTDIWHEIRSARALFRGEPAPAARTPARTEFTSLRVGGVVKDGVMTGDDLFAELPYMQITGEGSVDFVEATIDYSLRGRVLERPEFIDATGDELDEYTEAVIPFRIDGPLAAPGVSLDFDALVRERAERELDRARDRLIDELLGGGEGEPDADGEQTPEDAARDLLKDLLRR